MKTLNTAFIRLCLFFIAGILAGFYVQIPFAVLSITTGISLLFLLIAYYRANRLMLQDLFFGTTSLLLFFITGILTTSLHLPHNQPNHFIHQIESLAETEPEASVLATVKEELKPDLYSRKFIVEVQKVNNTRTHGKTLLLVPNDSLSPSLEPGDRVLVLSRVRPIPAPLNPHQFDYRSFMQHRGVYYQLRADAESLFKLDGSNSGIKEYAEKIRRRIIYNLEQQPIDEQELAIIQALLLGQRQQISDDTYYNYASAGVIHILAVSGLHVGIILFIIHRLLSPLARSRGGRFLRIAVTILLLWLFALLAGLSPSVIRAVTMFTFLAIALQMKRRTSVMNTLFLSLMALLLIRPQFIFEVGFQLSYLAVFSIVLLQPLLYNLFQPKLWLLKYLWGILSVTIAAQAGVLPLSLYYFHQFPGLFFLSNLVILPFLGLILGVGLLVILFAAFSILPAFLAEVYGVLIAILNKFVEWIALQEKFLFTEVPFSGKQVLAFYLLLFSLFLLLKLPGYKRTAVLLGSIVFLQLVYYYEAFSHSTEEVVVFHRSRETILGLRKERQLVLAHSFKNDPAGTNPVKSYVTGENLRKVNQQPLENIYRLKENVLLVIDSTGVYRVPGLNPDYVLLSNSPRINLDRFLAEYRPKAVIADGSNYSSLIEFWENSAAKANIPFHYTATQGAFRLRQD